MATSSLDQNTAKSMALPWSSDKSSLAHRIWFVFRCMGSLKITVTMFALGIVLLFVGTLAQDEQSIVDVKKLYFNSWIATVPLDVFKPQTIWPHGQSLPFSVPIPGGATVGLILLINLIAAKLTRFSMQAKGGRLAAGVFFTLLGTGLITLIVIGAHLGDGLQGEPPFSYDTLWLLCKGSVWLMTAAAIAWAVIWMPKTTLVRALAGTVALLLTCLAVFLAVSGDTVRMPDPGLRVTWQLSKSLIVGMVLLIGLITLFGKRGGNVLIHVGVALLMLGQFIFGDAQVEERVTIGEGDTTNEAYRIEEVELAIIDTSDEKTERVMAIDDRMLMQSARNQQFIEDSQLPFDVRAEQWMDNSQMQESKSADKNRATAGLGLQIVMVPIPKAGGVSEETNLASAYVTLRDKESKKEIGTYLVSTLLMEPQLRPKAERERVTVGDKVYELALRFRRSYKPYQITLENVQRIDYSGTEKPQDYSSFVKIADSAGSKSQEGRIWMNNPMRFQGETFYQSGYVSAQLSGRGVEVTTLQVVTNAGWLIPYVACVLSGLGMLSHFGGTFYRFASRYDRTTQSTEGLTPLTVKAGDGMKKPKVVPEYVLQARQARRGLQAWVAPLVGVALIASIALVIAIPRSPKRDAYDWYAAGKLPMQHEGRIKPLDTVARNILQSLSNKTSIYDESKKTRTLATEWMLGVMAGQAWVDDAPVFRIDAKNVLDEFKIDRVKGHRYSYNQIRSKAPEVREQLSKLDRDQKTWSFEQIKLADLIRKVGTYEVLKFAYQPILPEMPQSDTDGKAGERFQQEFIAIFRQIQRLEEAGPPAILPPRGDGQAKPEEGIAARPWQAFGPGLFSAFAAKVMQEPFDNSAVLAFSSVLDGIRAEEPRKFNRAVEDYKDYLSKEHGEIARLKKTSLEAWYNKFGAFNLTAYLYLFAAVVCFFSFLYARQHLRRAVFWMCLSIFVIHTIAIVGRIYISERPPVINLYSSAVFIGWAIALCGLVIELIEPMGLGSLLSSICGSLTMLVAYGLDTGDTMPELQAVLDTQFWLSTHVISVSLGYSATFFAGAFGIALLVHLATRGGALSALKPHDQEIQRVLYRICYGIVCFGLFFSFVGTVLGGLWGDDSWGRFWGWDPKENGALMIVLWNAILLHARWDKLVSPRGFALLAVGGNIVTAWSWFGTNQLGIGLHAYGGAQTDVLMILGGFVLSQAVVIIGGLVLTKKAIAAGGDS